MMLFFPKDFDRLKIIAYTSPDGDEWLTALEAKLKHREGMIYYSRHRPGARKKMVLTRRKATNFFRYYSEADSGGASAPELALQTSAERTIQLTRRPDDCSKLH